MLKTEVLKKLVDTKGILRGLAIDQRGSLEKMFQEASGRPALSNEIILFKSIVVEVLGSEVTAVLIDETYGKKVLQEKERVFALILPYEKSGYDTNIPGRLPERLPGATVAGLREKGAQAVKVLVYYDTKDASGVNETKKEFVRSVGEECMHENMPFLLEIVSYSEEGIDPKSLAFSLEKPERVIAALGEFSREEYKIDVLKMEFPVDLSRTEGTRVFRGEHAFTREEAITLLQKMSESAGIPFIFLSAGVKTEIFLEELVLANEAGTRYSGVLSGRATWQEGVTVYVKNGEVGLREWLGQTGIAHVRAINQVLDVGAVSLFSSKK